MNEAVHPEVFYIVGMFLPDINECKLGTDLCVNAECNNTDGSYACRPCFPGFIPGNLTSCSECLLYVEMLLKLWPCKHKS